MANNGDANVNTDITNYFVFFFFKCSSNKNGNQVQNQSRCQASASAAGHQWPQSVWAECPLLPEPSARPPETGNGSTRASSAPAPARAGRGRLCLSPLVYEGSGAPPEHNFIVLRGGSSYRFFWQHVQQLLLHPRQESSWADPSGATHAVLKPAAEGCQSLEVTQSFSLCRRKLPHEEEKRLIDISWYPVLFNETTEWLQTRVGISNKVIIRSMRQATK